MSSAFYVFIGVGLAAWWWRRKSSEVEGSTLVLWLIAWVIAWPFALMLVLTDPLSKKSEAPRKPRRKNKNKHDAEYKPVAEGDLSEPSNIGFEIKIPKYGPITDRDLQAVPGAEPTNSERRDSSWGGSG